MKIGLAGDWHGHIQTAQYGAKALRARDPDITHVYHLGDFGIWPGPSGRQYLDAVQGAFRRVGMTVYVTPGNHEDYDQITQIIPDEDDGLQWVRPNVALIPRGHRWVLGDRSFVSLGGAPSVDREWRQRRQLAGGGKTWWPEEMITDEDVDRAIEGGYADIMFAHDSPDGGTRSVQRIIDDPEGILTWGVAAIHYAREGRERMNRAYAAIQPRFFAHGHYHVADYDDDGERAFLSLNCNGFPRNLAILDLENYEVDWGF